MTTFTELETEVMAITGRPDLVSETEHAIRTITLRAHFSEEYYPDVLQVDTNTVYNEGISVHQIDVSTTPFVRFRKAIAVINKLTNQPLEEIDATTLFDSTNYLLDNVFYMAGTSINIRAAAIDSVVVTYMTKPNVAKATYSSWIANEYKELLVNGAAALVFDLIGKKDEHNRVYRYYEVGIKELKQDYMRN